MKLARLVMIMVLLLWPFNVLAHGQAENPTPEERRQAAQTFRAQLIEDRRQELSQARAQRILDRCEQLKTKIGQVAERLSAVRGARGNLAANLVQRLEAFSQRLAAAGLDTAALDEDIAQLKTLSDELGAQWQAHIDALNALAEAGCEEDAEPFHDALETAKAAMADVRAKYKEIKDFLTTEVKHDLEDLRSRLSDDNNAEAAE